MGTHLYGLEAVSGAGDEGVVGDWEIEVLERVRGGEAVSTGGRCLEHQEGGEKERIEDEVKERKEPGTVNALRAVEEIVREENNSVLKGRNGGKASSSLIQGGANSPTQATLITKPTGGRMKERSEVRCRRLE